ncbi:hypothetical protein PTKIN_Ptkin03bG0114900 [Pterospermum kingtungense]
MLGSNLALLADARNSIVPPSFPDGLPPPTIKTCLCNKFNTLKGCKFGDKCHFTHCDWELGKATGPTYEDPRGMRLIQRRMTGRIEPPSQGLGAATSFRLIRLWLCVLLFAFPRIF